MLSGTKDNSNLETELFKSSNAWSRW